MEYQVRQYSLHQGALEIEYIEEYLGEFEHPKRAADVVERLANLGLIRFGGHLPKGEYDVDHGGHEGQAGAAELHG